MQNAMRMYAREQRVAGLWSQEIGAWQALLNRLPKDTEAIRSLATAKTNQEEQQRYLDALKFEREGKVEPAKLQLERLYAKARYYGDPDGVAQRLGVTVPPSYDEEQQAHIKDEKQKRALAEQAWKGRTPDDVRAYYYEHTLKTSSFSLRLCASLFIGAGTILTWIAESLIWGAFYQGTLQGIANFFFVILFPLTPIGLTLIAISKGYYRCFNGRTFFWTAGLIGLLIIVGIVFKLVAVPNGILTQYSFPLIGTLQFDHAAPWGFAISWSLVFVPILGIVSFVVLQMLLDDGSFDYNPLAGCSSIIAMCCGFPIAVVNEFFGWSMGGAIAGLVLGVVMGLLSIPRDSMFDYDAGLLLIICELYLALVALISWPAMAILIQGDSGLVLQWLISAVVTTAGGFGIGASVRLFFVSEESFPG